MVPSGEARLERVAAKVIMMEGAPIDTMDIFGGYIGDDGVGVGMSDDRPIGPIGAGLLKPALTRCSSLVALNLRGNELGDDGVGCLAGDAEAWRGCCHG